MWVVTPLFELQPVLWSMFSDLDRQLRVTSCRTVGPLGTGSVGRTAELPAYINMIDRLYPQRVDRARVLMESSCLENTCKVEERLVLDMRQPIRTGIGEIVLPRFG